MGGATAGGERGGEETAEEGEARNRWAGVHGALRLQGRRHSRAGALCLLALLLPAAVAARLAAAPAADPARVAGEARAWRLRHERAVIEELAGLLALPNLASDAAGIERNAAAIEAMLARRGVATRRLTLAGAPPIVVGDLAAPHAARTIAFYAHYDGQPVDPAQWKSPPWTPVMRDAAGRDVDWRGAPAIDPEWRLYARSAGDDKAPIVAMAAALDALRAAGRAPAVDLRFVFEGEEEAGSPHLAAYLAKYPAVLHPDAWVLCDGPVHPSRRPLLFFGARGVVDLELTVYGPVKGLHDGHYGNWVPNPAMRLAHLLASMRDESGRILIPGFYDDVRPPTAAELAAVAAVPKVEAQLRREFEIGEVEGGGRPLDELLMLPALNVRGLLAGHVGAQASNTIGTEARASLDFRLVPNETPRSVEALVEKHLAAQGYTIVRDTPGAAERARNARLVRVVWGAGYPPARTPLDLPLSREVAAIMTAAGHEPVRLPTLGGSIPMYLFEQPLGVPGDRSTIPSVPSMPSIPVIGLPIANHDDNQHAADENLRLQNLWDGVELYSALFAGFARASP